MTVNPIQQNSYQKPARPSAPVNGAIFMGLMPENSITIFAENSITFDKGCRWVKIIPSQRTCRDETDRTPHYKS